MRDDSEPGGCGCLGLLLGFGFLTLFGGGHGHHEHLGHADAPWEPLPPPEFLDDPYGDGWDADQEFYE